MKKLNILAVAHSFPPRATSGAIRNLKIFENLSRLDCHIFVLTAKPRPPYGNDLKEQDQKIEGPNLKLLRCFGINLRESLISLKSRVRTLIFPGKKERKDREFSSLSNDFSYAKPNFFQSFKDVITESLSLPDDHLGWIPFSLLKSVVSVKPRDVDVIYAVGKPWSCLLTGLILKRLFQKPLVIDFMDPWMANEWRQPKGRLLDRVESVLEKRIVRHADFIIANTRELADNFRERFGIPEHRMGVVTCGFDPDIFRISPEPVRPESTKFTITHIGTFYNKRTPRHFLQAIKKLSDDGRIDPETVEINFIGRFNNYDPEIEEMITQGPLSRAINILPWIPHETVIRHLSRADLLLLIQPETHYQIPAKLYEYISMSKPILALCEENGAVFNIIRREKWGEVVAGTDIGAISEIVYQQYNNHISGKRDHALPLGNIQKYSYPELAKKTRDILAYAANLS